MIVRLQLSVFVNRCAEPNAVQDFNLTREGLPGTELFAAWNPPSVSTGHIFHYYMSICRMNPVVCDIRSYALSDLNSTGRWNHSIRVGNLLPCTLYSVCVWAATVVGNGTASKECLASNTSSLSVLISLLRCFCGLRFLIFKFLINKYSRAIQEYSICMKKAPGYTYICI